MTAAVATNQYLKTATIPLDGVRDVVLHTWRVFRGAEKPTVHVTVTIELVGLSEKHTEVGADVILGIGEWLGKVPVEWRLRSEAGSEPLVRVRVEG